MPTAQSPKEPYYIQKVAWLAELLDNDEMQFAPPELRHVIEEMIGTHLQAATLGAAEAAQDQNIGTVMANLPMLLGEQYMSQQSQQMQQQYAQQQQQQQAEMQQAQMAQQLQLKGMEADISEKQAEAEHSRSLAMEDTSHKNSMQLEALKQMGALEQAKQRSTIQAEKPPAKRGYPSGVKRK